MSNIDKQAGEGDVSPKTYYIHPMAFGGTQNPGYGHVPVVHADDFEKQRAKLEAAEKLIAELGAREVKPVAWMWERDGKRDVDMDNPDDGVNRIGAKKAIDAGWKCSPLYTAPPAPVSVPDEMTMQEALSAIDRLSWQECTRDAYMIGWNACRAAMLQSFGNSEQLNSPVIPDGWVACSERMPEREIDVQVYCSDKKEQMVGYMERNERDGYFRFASLPNGGGVYCQPTHWMPLPAAPQQEVKNG